MPDFKLWFTDGTTLTNNDIKNKVVVFKLWFTSCLPCLIDIGELNGLVDEYKNIEDILFIATALDNKDIIKNFIRENKFDFKIAYSSIETIQKLNTIQSYPSYFIVNRNGEFSYIDGGTKKKEFANLKKALERTLKE